MRTTVFFILLSISMGSFAQIFTISKADEDRALKKAKAETNMYLKKGYKAKGDKDMQTALHQFYTNTYLKNDIDNRKYVWGMGYGKASSMEQAYKDAYNDAIDNMPGLIISYFNMWLMVDKKSNAEEKNTISSAIDRSEKNIALICNALEYDEVVYFTGEKNGKMLAHIRTMYEYEKLKTIIRLEILKELRKTTDWSEEKILSLLTFEK